MTEDLNFNEADSTDAVAVIRHLEPVVLASCRSLKRQVTKSGYFISRGPRNLHGVLDAELDDSLARLAGPPATIKVEFDTPLNRDAYFRVVVWVTQWEPERCSVKIEVKGPNANETVGLIEQIRTRVGNEIQRLNEAGWTPAPKVGEDTGSGGMTFNAGGDISIQGSNVVTGGIRGNATADSGSSHEGKSLKDFLTNFTAGTAATVVGGILLTAATLYACSAPDKEQTPPAQSPPTITPPSSISPSDMPAVVRGIQDGSTFGQVAPTR